MMTVKRVIKLIPRHEVYALVHLNDDTSILVYQIKNQVIFQLRKLDPDLEIKAIINDYDQIILG